MDEDLPITMNIKSVAKSGDEEAPKDPGLAAPNLPSYSEKDFEGHRAHTMYVGVHVPNAKRRSHHRHHRRHRHHPERDIAEEDDDNTEDCNITPAQRVQFILGEEEDDNTHESHPLFSEMEELSYQDGEPEWNETARWVKFEEDVEEGGARWSKPHVATLSLHSLFELRSLLLNGTVLLDAEATSLGQVADLAIDAMLASGHLPFAARERVRDALLRRHRHLYEKNKENSAAKLPIIRSLADIGRNYSASRNGAYTQAFPNPDFDKRSFSRSPSSVVTSQRNNGSEDEPEPSPSTSLLEKSDQKGPYLSVPITSSIRGSLTVGMGEERAGLNRRESTPSSSQPTTPAQRLEPPKFDRFLSVPDSANWHGSQAHGMATSPSSASMLRNASGTDLENGGIPKGNTPFMKKIPPGSEASNVLVGEVDFLDKPVSAFIRLSSASVLGDLTEVPVPTRFIFLLLGPVGGQSGYHEIGRAVATLMADEVFHEVAYRARSRDHLLAGLDEFLDAVTVLPPGEWDPNIRIEPPAAIPSQNTRKYPEAFKEEVDEEEEEARIRQSSGLVRSGRLFGGMIDDIKRKLPWYLSDYKDAMSLQCVAAFTFLYFACLTPLITFGGLLGDATENRLGTMESLCSGFVCGVIYGIFSGQPLTILGSTGPVLVFETILYSFCKKNELDYLALRLWIGIWIGIILLLLVAYDASAFVCYITRFTEENFALLIATIFIYKAIEKLIHIGHKYPLEPPLPGNCSCIPDNFSVYEEDFSWSSVPVADCIPIYNGTLDGSGCFPKPWYPNVFLMSIILCFATFLLCVTLKNMRNTNFFPSRVRSTISDFGVFLAICSMAGLDVWSGIHTPKLDVPAEFKPTWEGRGWFIPPFTNPWWTIPAAIAPALLATILIFMDQQITAVIVNRRENKLNKGCGYHLDLFVLAILIIVNSLLGLPWFVAATVLSINHVNALKLQTETSAPGERPQFLGVREQRVTHILIFLMVGLSVFMTPVLTYIPMPVLYGVFLYMGCSPLSDMQFCDRLLIIFMPTKYQPDHSYLRKVPLRRVHLFTFIQFLCFVTLWVVKTIDAISIAFPLMLVVMIGVRKSLDYVFTQYELKALDDLMPEKTSKKPESESDEETGSAIGMKSLEGDGKNIQIQLPNGNIMNIPVDASKTFNISQEVNRSGVWKTVNSSVKLNSMGESKPTCLKNRRSSP